MRYGSRDMWHNAPADEKSHAPKQPSYLAMPCFVSWLLFRNRSRRRLRSQLAGPFTMGASDANQPAEWKSDLLWWMY